VLTIDYSDSANSIQFFGAVTPIVESQSAANQALTLAKQSQPQAATTRVQTEDDGLVAFMLEPDPDPALDPALILSQQHASPGATVTVTTTVRNLGRELATELVVKLYAGTPLTGTLLSSENIATALEMNDTLQVTFDVVAAGGEQPLTALLTTNGEDLNPANNQAVGNLGELPPPHQLVVSISSLASDALDLTWLAPTVQGVAGYRILRGQSPGGPYELVGEATLTRFTDLLLERDRTYYYAIQAFDDAGVRSSISEEAYGRLPLFEQLLPLLMMSATGG
jgi:hypothetical protein